MYLDFRSIFPRLFRKVASLPFLISVNASSYANTFGSSFQSLLVDFLSFGVSLCLCGFLLSFNLLVVSFFRSLCFAHRAVSVVVVFFVARLSFAKRFTSFGFFLFFEEEAFAAGFKPYFNFVVKSILLLLRRLLLLVVIDGVMFCSYVYVLWGCIKFGEQFEELVRHFSKRALFLFLTSPLIIIIMRAPPR